MSTVTIRHVTKAFGKNVVLKDFDDTFRERLRCFVRQIDRGDKPEDIDGSGVQGLEAQKVIHAAIRSLDTGSVVYLDEMFPNK